MLSIDQQTAFSGPQLLTSALVQVSAGSDVETVKGAVADALAGHPDARVMNQDEFEKAASGIIDSLLTFVTVMLLLAVLIALLGIINTLALSVFERTRELGLLRAVGMTRGQVRGMVRWESVVISLIGALTGASARNRHRTCAGPSTQGPRDHRDLDPRQPAGGVRRTCRCGRRPRRTGPLPGRSQGRRAQGRGHRLGSPPTSPLTTTNNAPRVVTSG